MSWQSIRRLASTGLLGLALFTQPVHEGGVFQVVFQWVVSLTTPQLIERPQLYEKLDRGAGVDPDGATGSGPVPSCQTDCDRGPNG